MYKFDLSRLVKQSRVYSTVTHVGSSVCLKLFKKLYVIHTLFFFIPFLIRVT